MNKEEIRKALDHFENDKFMDAKEILTKEIQAKRDEFLTNKLGLKKEDVNEAEIAGWIAMFNGKKLEIKKDEANGIYGAKQLAIKKLNVPKSKVGLLAIKPAYDE